jgi:CheY-like chemotaxis protein
MRKNGPIIVIEDDLDDQALLKETFSVLNYPNEVIYFSDGYDALEFLTRSQTIPLLILSDINMPKINGFELQKKIHNNEQLKNRCIPYLFFTTGADRESVYAAYALSAQGFFFKPSSVSDLQRIIQIIMDYWYECYSPSQYTAITR